MEIIGYANMNLYCGITKNCPKCHRKGYLQMRQHGQFQIAHYEGRKRTEEGKSINKISYCPQPNLKDIINKYLQFLNKQPSYTHRYYTKKTKDIT
jgi:hypothetical protein